MKVIALKGRWAVWLTGLALLALLILFPLRLALDMVDLERFGLSASKASGTVWQGRIHDARFGKLTLGTLDAGLNPFGVLIGRASLGFDRTEHPDGPLTGRILASGSRNGIRNMTGRLGVGGLLAPLPIDALEFTNATALFEDGQCVDANGTLKAIVGTRFAGLDLTQGMVGALSCDGERVRVAMTSATGLERVDVYVSSSGRYRAWLRINPGAPDLAAALALFGFTGSGGGMGLSVEGRF